MPIENFERDLKELINRGVDISEQKENRIYLRSSFKRTVSGWKSDYNKVSKVTDETKQLKLQEKLKEKMKKEADKYLKNKKDYLNENNISVAKNPQRLAALRECQNKINNVNKCFSQAYDAVNNKILPKCENAYKLYKTLTMSDINFTVDKIKKANINSIGAISTFLQDETTNLKKEFTGKFIKDLDFLYFISCYANLKKCKEKKFSDWFETEYSYLKRFKSLTDKEIIEYRKHGASLEKATLIEGESENLYNALNDLCKFCKENETKNTLKYYAKRLLGAYLVADNIGAIAISVLSANIPLQLISILWTMFNPGFDLLNAKKKSLYESIDTYINKINNEIDSLTDEKPEKNDLNLKKVAYMHEVSKELGQK